MAEYNIFRYRTYHLFHAKRWDELCRTVESADWRQESLRAGPNGFMYSLDLDRAFDAALNLQFDGVAPLCALALLAPQSAIAGFELLSLEGLITVALLDLDVTKLVVRNMASFMDRPRYLKAKDELASYASKMGLAENAREIELSILEEITPDTKESLQLLLRANAGNILANDSDSKLAQEILTQIRSKSDSIVTQPPRDSQLLRAGISYCRLKARLGHQSEAISELRHILEQMLDDTPQNNPFIEKLRCQLDICVALYEAGDTKLAESTIKEISKPIIKLKSKNPVPHVERLAAIAQSLWTIGDAGGDQVFRLLQNSSEAIATSWFFSTGDKIQVLGSTALVALIRGNLGEADSYLQWALNMARSIDPARSTSQLSRAVSESFQDLLDSAPRRMLQAGRVSELANIRGISEYSIGGRDQEIYSRVLALCQLGKFLGQSGAYEGTEEVSSLLLMLSDRLKRGPQSIFEEVFGLAFPGTHAWLMVYARLIDLLLKSGEERLIRLAMVILEHPLDAEKSVRAALERIECTAKNSTVVPRVVGLWRGQFVPTIAAGLIDNCMWTESVQFLERNTRFALSGGWPREWMEELAANDHLNDAIRIMNRRVSFLAGCLVGCFTIPGIGIALLWLALLPFYNPLCSCATVVATICILVGSYYLVLSQRSKSREGSWGAVRVLSDEEDILAIVRGVLRRKDTRMAENLVSKLSPMKWEKAQALVLIARAAAQAGDIVRCENLLADTFQILIRGKLDQNQKRLVIVGVCHAIVCVSQDSISAIRQIPYRCLKVSNDLTNTEHRIACLAAICSALKHVKETELHEETYEKLVSLVGKDTKLQRIVVHVLRQLEDSDMLFSLWSEHPLSWMAKDTLEEAATLVIAKSQWNDFDVIVRTLHEELLPDDFAEFAIGSVLLLIEMSQLDRARHLLRGNLETIGTSIKPDKLPGFGQSAIRLGLVPQATVALRERLDSCRNILEADEFTLPQRIRLLGNIANAFANLKTDEANQLALEALQILFLQSRGRRLAGVGWHTLWFAVPGLFAVGGKDLLLQTWKHVSHIADVETLMKTDLPPNQRRVKLS